MTTHCVLGDIHNIHTVLNPILQHIVIIKSKYKYSHPIGNPILPKVDPLLIVENKENGVLE